eukprot:gb/GECG01007020.1/.p1 GENE.gb/GECG01007020.1/~~gb/GECG01007020.1/.p1  ORF type:complete len:207 (+),score=16.54 gb/GECG01007020.1/:1-621(+)
MCLLCGFVVHRRQRNCSHGHRYENRVRLYARESGVSPEALHGEENVLDTPNPAIVKFSVQSYTSCTQIESVNPLVPQSIHCVEPLHTNNPYDLSGPRTEILDSVDSSGRKTAVRVGSSKKPKLESGSRSGHRHILKVAVAPKIDHSQFVERVILSLREWKASLLSEPPPLAEVETESHGWIHVRRQPVTSDITERWSCQNTEEKNM